MGWASESELCGEIAALAREHVCKSARPKFYAKLIELFEAHDCDTLHELDGDPEFTKALKKAHPEWHR